MRIFYLSRVSFLTRKAHLHNIIKTCEFLGATLVTTFRSLKKEELENLLKEHRVTRAFPVISLNASGNHLQWSSLRAVNWLGVLLENFSLIKFLFFSRKKIDIIYFRDYHIFLAVIFGKYFLQKPVFLEAHAAKRKRHTRILMDLMARIANGIIAISWQLKKHYEKLNKNIAVAFCWSAEKENFPYHKSKEELRKELNLPPDKIIIGYTGRLDLSGVHSNYEMDKVIEALKLLPPSMIFLIIGATEKEAKTIGTGPNLKVYPRLPHSKIPAYLLAFDILVIPKLGDLPGDSPAKMFEYLAAGRPIVAARTEPVEEVLRHGENALLVFPNTPEEWAKSIKRLVDNKELSDKISQKAIEDSEKYTWEARAKKILELVAK